MRTKKKMTSLSLALSLLCGASGAAAQDNGAAKKAEEIQVREQLILSGQEAVRVPFSGPVGMVEPALIRGDTFTYLSTEMSFNGKVVKGSPYSAQAVTETVQVLADGNRIVRKNTADIYRDAEGRTRREFTLNAIGPWAHEGEAPRTISINDPVANVSYTLDPRTRTAHKMQTRVLGRGPARFVDAHPEGTATVIARPVDGKNVDLKPLEALRLADKAATLAEKKTTLGGRVLNSVEAVYPERAKAAGARGTVAVKLTVNQAGAVESAEAVGLEDQSLREAAVAAARQWRFRPDAGAEKSETGFIVFEFGDRATAAGTLPKIYESTVDGKKANVMTFSRTAVGPHGAQPDAQTESLGKQVIEGVEAEGTRTTRTIPAGAIGNEQPIQIVSERWYSQELQTLVMSRSSDPRTGETTYRLTNISRGEPSPSLFQVPSDYTVKEPQSFIKQLRPVERLAAPKN